MTIRKWFGSFLLLCAASLLVSGQPAPCQEQQQSEKARPRVEVVFCLDTTGSMGGLIDSAKQKIWSVCNQIAGGRPTPEVKMGLVAYRDRGDTYITKTFDLSSDLDEVHGHLMCFQAAGGGDIPESVNEALHVALHNVHWSTDDNVLRIIYLVGDAPPHTDYDNDISYKETCKQAAEKGIIINTIQCGSDQSTTSYWKEIAQLSQGRFVQIAQDGGTVTVSTPFDKRLAEINGTLAKSSIVYGDAPTQAANLRNATVAALPMSVALGSVSTGSPTGGPATTMLVPSSAPAPHMLMAAADRAGFNAKTGKVGAWDLIDNIKAGNVKLEDLKTEELPEPMQKLSLAERKSYLAKVEDERNTLQAEARELDRQRMQYINEELNRREGSSSFDAQVMEILREQAKKVKIDY